MFMICTHFHEFYRIKQIYHLQSLQPTCSASVSCGVMTDAVASKYATESSTKVLPVIESSTKSFGTLQLPSIGTKSFRRVDNRKGSAMETVAHFKAVVNRQKRVFLIDPYSPYCQVWDQVVFVALIFTALITPYEVAYLPTYELLRVCLFRQSAVPA